MGCDCRVCERQLMVTAEIARQVTESGKMILTQLLDDLANAEMDRDYFRAIVRGEWPDSDSILANIRNKDSVCS